MHSKVILVLNAEQTTLRTTIFNLRSALSQNLIDYLTLFWRGFLNIPFQGVMQFCTTLNFSTSLWTFEWKQSLTLDFRTNSIFKDSWQKILIFGQYAIPYMLNTTIYNHETWQNVQRMYILKSKKFLKWKVMSKSRLRNVWPKSGVSGKTWNIFFVAGQNLIFF